MNKGLDELMSMNWHPKGNETEDGYVITVPALDDFAVHGNTEDEAWADYLEALQSHLAGYLEVNKQVPVPFTIEQEAPTTDELVPDDSRNALAFEARIGVKYEMAGS